VTVPAVICLLLAGCMFKYLKKEIQEEKIINGTFHKKLALSFTLIFPTQQGFSGLLKI